MYLKRTPLAALVLAALMLAAGCTLWRVLVPASPSGAPASDVSVPEVTPERRKAALFYSDLGPETVDASSYPAERKRDYEVYARVCSRCHTLARSINAPYVSRGWWEFYVARMRVRAKFHGKPLTKSEVKAVLDFLEYDSNERKVAHAAEFDATKAVLKRRFEAALDERIEGLQKQTQPRLIP
ncbi:MAG: hypothetical protein HY923_00615 [Elusimicrobia bacterium]|nr:hypothetical protein [Elusimicrobiota bacterium]